MSNEVQYLTTEKHAQLTQELHMLKTERRKEVAEHLEYAKKLGDLSENAEYHQAREEQAEVEDRIGRLENLLKHATITRVHGKDVVTIGSTVSLEKDNKPMVFTIVGSEESDMTHGKISNLSPLGSALLGHKKDDRITVMTPKGKAEYLIAAIK